MVLDYMRIHTRMFLFSIMFYTQVNLGSCQENKMRISIQAKNIPAEKMLEDYLTMVMMKQARVLMHTFKKKKERNVQ